MKWTQDYPTVGGWYWVKATFDGHPRLDHYWEASDGSGLLTCTDSDFDEYGPEHHKGFWFSDEPIKEPE